MSLSEANQIERYDAIKRALENEFHHQQRIGSIRFYPSLATIEALAKKVIQALDQIKSL